MISVLLRLSGKVTFAAGQGGRTIASWKARTRGAAGERQPVALWKISSVLHGGVLPPGSALRRPVPGFQHGQELCLE